MRYRLLIFALLAPIFMLMPEAYAAGKNTNMGYVLCNAALWLTGNTGKGLAVVAVCITGIGAMLGKVSWGTVLLVGIGIAIIFGAGPLVDNLTVVTNAGTVPCSTNELTLARPFGGPIPGPPIILIPGP